MIQEIIVTTRDAAGKGHIAPMGVRNVDGNFIISPFRPSTTLDNLTATGVAVINYVDDVRVFAGCLTGRRDFELTAATHIDCPRLACALGHVELKVADVAADDIRPRFTCQPINSFTHWPWTGFNRAQFAVIEAAILASRLDMLPPEKIDRELEYLTIAIDKTAGARELEAWGWLMERIEAHRAGQRP